MNGEVDGVREVGFKQYGYIDQDHRNNLQIERNILFENTVMGV